MKYTQRLRALREDHDYTQTQIAKIIGTNQKVYSRYETGENKIPIDRLIMLCNFYKVSADWILGIPQGYEYPNTKIKIR